MARGLFHTLDELIHRRLEAFAHLIADHKRSAVEADELIVRFNVAKPIPEPEPEPHMYCATEAQRSGGRQSRDGGAAAPEMLVD